MELREVIPQKKTVTKPRHLFERFKLLVNWVRNSEGSINKIYFKITKKKLTNCDHELSWCSATFPFESPVEGMDRIDKAGDVAFWEFWKSVGVVSSRNGSFGDLFALSISSTWDSVAGKVWSSIPFTSWESTTISTPFCGVASVRIAG